MQCDLSEVLDYRLIEDLIYTECDRPHDILGAHLLKDGFLVAAFIPYAASVTVCFKNEEYKLSKEEQGFFAVLLDKDKECYEYYFRVQSLYEKEPIIVNDPYRFLPTISEDEVGKHKKGIWYESYEKMGAHYQNLLSLYGTSFAVWAPNAVRVSVVGDFNNWDSSLNQMRRIGDSGIFELFVPNAKIGDFYKYEIKTASGEIFLKADPYANSAELRPDNASIIADMAYEFMDRAWLEKQKNKDLKASPMFVYELHLGSFMSPFDGREFYNYRELAKLVVSYVKDVGYTHVELMPVMEHPFDGSWGYQVTGYYAPTKRYGNPTDFMYFVDYLHQNDIGVIIDWVPAHFPKDDFALARFDGTHLYEHADKRQGEHPHWGTLIYNYGLPQVSNFLISNALFWAEKYHVDGIRFDAVASMLYLDYGKNDGEWVANKYGGNQNLEAIEFLKHLNSIMKQKYSNVALIAEESTAFPKVSGSLNDGGLGFDFKWNMGWMNDVLSYAKTDPIFRGGNHHKMTFGMMYAYSENYILPFSHDEVVHLKGSMFTKMPGNDKQKYAGLKTLYTFMMGHPGKKLLFMGQDLGQKSEWVEDKAVDFSLLNDADNKDLHDYFKKLLSLYKNNSSLYETDYMPEGFLWLDVDSSDKNIFAFCRKNEKETLVFFLNFSGNPYKKYELKVPTGAEYSVVLDTNGNINKTYKAKLFENEIDGEIKDGKEDKSYYIEIDIEPLSAVILKQGMKIMPDSKSVGNKKSNKKKK